MKTFCQYITDATTPKTFWGNHGAGCLVICPPTGRVLLGLRSQGVMESHTWGIFGGKVDDDDKNPKESALRELEEETGYRATKAIRLSVFRHKKGFTYTNFLVTVPREFVPTLNWENGRAEWFSWGDFPKNLHFGLEELLKDNKAQKIIAKHLAK